MSGEEVGKELCSSEGMVKGANVIEGGLDFVGLIPRPEQAYDVGTGALIELGGEETQKLAVSAIREGLGVVEAMDEEDKTIESSDVARDDADLRVDVAGDADAAGKCSSKGEGGDGQRLLPGQV